MVSSTSPLLELPPLQHSNNATTEIPRRETAAVPIARMKFVAMESSTLEKFAMTETSFQATVAATIASPVKSAAMAFLTQAKLATTAIIRQATAAVMIANRSKPAAMA